MADGAELLLLFFLWAAAGAALPSMFIHRHSHPTVLCLLAYLHK
jgi:hypothetical protein